MFDLRVFKQLEDPWYILQMSTYRTPRIVLNRLQSIIMILADRLDCTREYTEIKHFLYPEDIQG